MKTTQEMRTIQTKAISKSIALHLLAFLVFIAACGATGCARLKQKAAPHIYEGPLVEVRRLDTSCLKAKRIVLDPGHGGTFPGAIGKGGVKEAQVNLGVALYLWGMLRDAGAEVFLTRSSDRDFLNGDRVSLRDDLSRRVEVALTFKPDLFVSLHHNADLSRSRDRNQIETYFKMLDDGPSRDVARLIHERLTESLGIQKGEVIPGNYFVLRNMPCGAVLVEPSYLSNPWVEEKLRLADKQLLEAQAYFLGILEYFRRGVPQIVSLSPCDTVLTDAQPTLIATLSGERSPIDTLSVLVKLDGAAIPRNLGNGNDRVKARPEKPLANGRHEFCVSCRNVNGNSSGQHCCSFEVSLPPFSLVAETWPDCAPGSGGVLVTAEVKDVNGNVVKDGTLVEFSGRAGAFSTDTVGTLGGVVTSVFFPDSSYGEEQVSVGYRSLRDSLFLGDSLILESCAASAHVSTRTLRIVSANTGEPLTDARLWLWNKDSLCATSSPQGLIVFNPDPKENNILTRRGFIPIPISTPIQTPTPAPISNTVKDVLVPGPSPTRTGPTRSETVSGSAGAEVLMTVKMETAASGLFRNAKVVVDIGHASQYEGKTQSGSQTSIAEKTGSDNTKLNTQVAACLEKILSGAGAQVLLLGDTVSDEEKVRVTELFGAQLYFRFELSSQKSPSMVHYPGSNTGKELAEKIAHVWNAMLLEKEPSIREGAQYVIRQTSCPALIVMLPSSAKGGDEKYSPTVAYAFFLGILEDRGLKHDQLAELSVKTANNVQDKRLEVALDEFISLPAVRGETVTFFCEEGTHLVTIRSPEGKRALRFVALRKGERAKLDLGL